jgi:hypothetical protein
VLQCCGSTFKKASSDLCEFTLVRFQSVLVHIRGACSCLSAYNSAGRALRCAQLGVRRPIRNVNPNKDTHTCQGDPVGSPIASGNHTGSYFLLVGEGELGSTCRLAHNGEGHAVRSGIGGAGPDGLLRAWRGRWRYRTSWTSTKWRRSTLIRLRVR